MGNKKHAGSARRSSNKIQDSEIVRAKLKKQQRGGRASKLEEALKLNAQARVYADISDTGKIGEWIGSLAAAVYGAYWILAILLIVSASSGSYVGYSGVFMLNFVYASAPIVFTSSILWLLVAYICLRVRKNSVRQRRLNTLTPWVFVGFLLVGISTALGQPIVFVLGYPLSTIIMFIMYFRCRMKDRWEINMPSENDSVKIERMALILLIVLVIALIIGTALSYGLLDFLQLLLQTRAQNVGGKAI